MATGAAMLTLPGGWQAHNLMPVAPSAVTDVRQQAERCVRWGALSNVIGASKLREVAEPRSKK